MKKLKKILALAVTASMVMSFAGCSALNLGNKTASEIEDAATSYMELLISGKYEKAAKLVKDGEDAITAAELDDDHMAVLEALLATTEFEIEDADGEKEKSGKCTVTVTVADIEDAVANAEGTTSEDIVAAIADADTVEESFSLKFTYDDEWLIKDASPVTSYYIDAANGVEFSALSEDAALEFVDAHFATLVDGDLAALYEMADVDESYEEWMDEYNSNPMIPFFMAVLSTLDYECEVEEAGDDYVNIAVTGTMTDPQACIDVAFDDEVYAASGAYGMFGDDNMENPALQILTDNLNASINTISDTADCYWLYEVTVDEDGNLQMEEIDSNNPLENAEFGSNDFEGRDEELILMSLEYALEHGMCTQEQYDELMALYGGTPAGASYYEINEGSDFWRLTVYSDDTATTEVDAYHIGDAGFFITFQTVAYYDAGSTISVTLEMEGRGVIYEGTSAPLEANHVDSGYAFITAEGGIQAGEYDLTVIGYNGEVFAVVHFVVAD